jgi:hypothetical protein
MGEVGRARLGGHAVRDRGGQGAPPGALGAPDRRGVGYRRGGPAPLRHAAWDIPVEATLISVADAYDAMTSGRPYRRALSHDRAGERLVSGAESQFDPAVVEATEDVLRDSGAHAAVAGPHPWW